MSHHSSELEHLTGSEKLFNVECDSRHVMAGTADVMSKLEGKPSTDHIWYLQVP